MFDDQPIGQAGQSGGTPPANLPIGEPEDIFAGAGADEPASEAPPPAPVIHPGSDAPASDPTGGAPLPEAPLAMAREERPAMSSALDVGVLNRRTTPAPPPLVSPRPVPSPLPPAGGLRGASAPPLESPVDHGGGYDVKKPSFIKELLVVILVVVALIAVAGGGWWLYRRIAEPKPVAPPPSPTETPLPELAPTQTTAPAPATQTTDDAVLFGEPVDADGDGLDDAREQSLGTDSHNWDTDGDGLSDGDEVLIWHTNPLNPDTDADGYQDGVEVKNGFNPNGPGKIFGTSSTTKP